MTVLERLRTLLSTEPAAAGADPPEQLAVAALLAEMARADLEVSKPEQERMQSLLARRYQLDQVSAERLLQQGLAGATRAVSLYDYVRLLNQRLDYPARLEVVQMLWEIAFADGRLDKHEEHELRKIAALLYVSDEDFIRAKLRVTERSS